MNRLHVIRLTTIGAMLVAAVMAGRAATGSVELAIDGRSNAYGSLAAKGDFAVVVWGASTRAGVTDVYAASSRDGGRTFSGPSRVNHVAGDANFSGEQPPRLALVPRNGREPGIVVVWTAKAPSGTRLVSSRSDDGGKSFAAAAPVPGSNGAGNRGWESIDTAPDGAVVALWLDHRDSSSAREKSGAMKHDEHQHLHSATPADGVARAQLSRLFFATLDKADSPRSITGGVCYCCKTAIATDASGGVYAAWRHVYPGNVRDIAFTKSVDGGRNFTPPVRISDDNWVLDGCPENGPAMTVDRNRRIHVVWPTLVPGPTPSREPTMALFYATSQDGRSFTARQQIPTEGVPRHPQIALRDNGQLIVAWDEQARGTRRVAIARGSVDAKGIARFTRQPIGDTLRAEYPVIATVDDATIVAWTSGSSGQTTLRTQRLMN